MRILAATDFSVRSDRALRRAAILAHAAGAELVLVHAIDDDQPARLVEEQRRAAADQLEEMARTVRELDGTPCRGHIALGPSFRALTQAAEELDAALIVLGPHRRQVLRDVFIGTTAERTIRETGRPVLMANGFPAGPYRRILLAAELSEQSLASVSAVQALGLDQGAELVVLHAFASPLAVGPGLSGANGGRDDAELVAEAAQAADHQLLALLERIGLERTPRILRPVESPIPQVIAEAAAAEQADLVVLAHEHKSSAERWLLGSVSETVLRDARVDVLVVTPPEPAAG